MTLHIRMSWSLARSFFCNLKWGSAISTKPISPITTCGEDRVLTKVVRTQIEF